MDETLKHHAAIAIKLAADHVAEGPMSSIAESCFNDAIALFILADYAAAARRAVVSLSYSVGVYHHDHMTAKGLTA